MLACRSMSGDDRHSGEGSDGPSDVALIHGVTSDGELRILRKREDRLELGGVRPLREGVPITGEVVRLTPRKEFPLLCDVRTELAAPPSAGDTAAKGGAEAKRKGPAQVASDRYRDNWDKIFARPQRGDLLN